MSDASSRYSGPPSSRYSAALDHIEHLPAIGPYASRFSPEERAAVIAQIIGFDRDWVPLPLEGQHDYATPSRWFG
jgi:hypothetical protein